MRSLNLKADGIPRRAFLKGLTFTLGGSLYLTGCGPASRKKTWRVFTASEAELVEAITVQIIPTDHDPGAKEAGCVDFIDKQLAGFYRQHQSLYRMGLAGVDQTSLAVHQNPFIALTWEQQTDILRQLEGAKAPGNFWKELSSREFFRLIRDHTMQGFYGSPRHGGNRDYVSYKMIGLEYPQIVGQNRYSDS